jgi:hypothetical protein
MTYFALVMALLEQPLATAIASIVSVELTVIGPVYGVDEVVGGVPSVV